MPQPRITAEAQRTQRFTEKNNAGAQGRKKENRYEVLFRAAALHSYQLRGSGFPAFAEPAEEFFCGDVHEEHDEYHRHQRQENRERRKEQRGSGLER